MSVSVMTGDDVARSGTIDVFDVSARLPVFQAVQNAGPVNTGFRIRRIGNEPNIPNFESAVGLFVDGVYRIRSGVATGDILDIERIEVIAGPQATLYGRSTNAGVINFIPNRPSRDRSAGLEMTIGNYEGYGDATSARLEGFINGALTRSLSGRLSGSFLDAGHTTGNLLNGDDTADMRRYSVRGQLSFEPDGPFDARLSVGRYAVSAANLGDAEVDQGLAIAGINASIGLPCPSDSVLDRAICLNRAGIVDMRVDELSLHAIYTLSNGSVSATTGYDAYNMVRDADADQLNAEVLRLVDRQAGRSLSQEIRLDLTGYDAVEAGFGAYFYRHDFKRGDPTQPIAVLGEDAGAVELMPGFPVGQPGDASSLYSTTATRHVSVFGDLLFHATPRLEIHAAIRQLYEDKDMSITNTANHARPTLLTVALTPPPASTSLARDYDSTSWRLAARYKVRDDTMTYVSVSKGVKPGGFNAGFGAVAPADREFDSERVFNVEAGLKATLLAGRASLALSVFDATYDRFQSAGFVGLRFLVNNAEEVRVTGAEAHVRAVFGENLAASLAVSYADARYESYDGGACHFGRAPDNPSGTACVLDGATLPLAPLWRTAATLDYTREVALGRLHGRLDWSWTDRYFTNASLDPRHVQPAHGIVNLRLGIGIGDWDVTGWVHNASDETVVMQAGPANLFPMDPASSQFLAAPRSYGITLRRTW